MKKTPIKKTVKKTVAKKAPVKKEMIFKSKKFQKEITDDIKVLKKKIISLTQEAKEKYDSADEKTKKQIITGVAGAATLIAGIIGAKKIKGKK